MATGLIYHELYMWHNNTMCYTGYVRPSPTQFIEATQHFESQSTKRRFYNILCASNLIDHLKVIKPRHATAEQIQFFHTPEYVAKVKAMSDAGNGGEAGPQVPIGAGSYEIALLATGGILEALDRIMKGDIQNAYALVRPPGHHAEANLGMGFCVFNNVVIGARYLQKEYGLKRIAIVDWDVHHPNGTQKAFYNESGVLLVSVHQNGNYPNDTGFIDEKGAGEGEHYNVNIPLPPGSGRGAFKAAFDRVVIPALDAYKPEIIIVSSGFDACFMDPQASMMLCSDDFRYFATVVKAAAERHCGGKLLLAHEGGYSNEQVPFCGAAVVEVLCGKSVGIKEPFIPDIALMAEQDLQEHQDARIKKVETEVLQHLIAKCKK